PWSGNSLAEKSVPAYPGGGIVFRPTEYWASFVDSNGFGLTVYTVPHCPYWAAQQFPSHGANFLAPLVQSDIPSNSVIKTTAYLIAGNYLDARGVIYSLKENESPTTAWEFNRDGDREGWLPWNQLTPFTVSDGTLKTSSTGTDPHMQIYSALDIDAGVCKTIEIRMKISAGNIASIYFTTITDEIWDENKVKYFNISPGNKFIIYNLDMGLVGTWEGRISQIRLDPSVTSGDIEIDYIRLIQTVNVNSDNQSPENFLLSQNYPNPFNINTKFDYFVPKLSKVTFKIYNISGEEINTLVNASQPAGHYEILWSAEGFSSGIYFAKLQSGEFIQVRKIILLK
ncbi:MAG: T9SS type A sorting domain-containing protein, partial [bacterium]